MRRFSQNWRFSHSNVNCGRSRLRYLLRRYSIKNSSRKEKRRTGRDRPFGSKPDRDLSFTRGRDSAYRAYDAFLNLLKVSSLAESERTIRQMGENAVDPIVADDLRFSLNNAQSHLGRFTPTQWQELFIRLSK